MSMSREVGDAEGLAFSIGMAAVQRNFHGDNDQALRLAEESLALSDKAGIKWFKRRILSAVGYISQALGNHERARSAFQESLTLSREDGDLTFITFMFSCLGFLELDQGQYAQALILFQEGLHLAREVKNRNLIAEDFQNMGEVNIILGQYSQAKALLEESLAVDREVGNYRRQALVLRLLGRVARLQDNYENARKLYVESLQLAQRNNLRTTLAWCLVGMAALQNEPQKGVRLLSAADAMPELYSSVYPYERFELENISNTIRAKLDETDFNTEWELGKQMSLDEVVAYASKELQ
jgi:tetratricopeptide (TPR) repeat protein